MMNLCFFLNNKSIKKNKLFNNYVNFYLPFFIGHKGEHHL